MMLTNAIDNQANGYTGLAYISNPYCSGYADSMNAFTAPLKAESGLTCSLPVSRKRPRDINVFHNLEHNHNQNQIMFLGEDISLQIQQQQLEIDQFIAHQTEKLRLDIEERRKRSSQRIIAAIEERISKRLRAKDEEITKIAKLNWALEEKVKSLSVENQIWKQLAQTNEATANALRTNLKQVLEQAEFQHHSAIACEDDAAEDAESCCESNSDEKRALVNHDDCSSRNTINRLCNKCAVEESCVLLLPCRHLCLCTGCASSVNICPVCKSTKNISVHVNMS